MKLAREPKELYVVQGETYIGLYDHLNDSLPKLAEFFTKNIGS
jgi:uncharacterized protein